MGREIRKVPANWQHPKSQEYPDRMQSMFDENYSDARAEWLEGLRAWEAGEDKDREAYKNDDGTYMDYWEWSGAPPTRAYYRPWNDDEATWFQLWETVSEGTPVTPPFATQQELADYLAVNGDEWDQSCCNDPHSCALFGLTPGKPGWGKEQAEKFVFGAGWAPSMVITGGRLMSGVEAVTQN
jgi:hypothetical protein